MGDRLDLHAILVGILGSNYVYFQPPSTINMNYPCIVYSRNRIRTTFADNSPYSLRNEYSVTVIDKNPDSTIPMKVAMLESCLFERHFTSDGLNHDVFLLHF